jgi:hypothetical protein
MGAYRGCQKNVPVLKRFFLQPLMPQFRIWEHYYGKRYKRLDMPSMGSARVAFDDILEQFGEGVVKLSLRRVKNQLCSSSYIDFALYVELPVQPITQSFNNSQTQSEPLTAAAAHIRLRYGT